jgi:hypothetical protein
VTRPSPFAWEPRVYIVQLRRFIVLDWFKYLAPPRPSLLHRGGGRGGGGVAWKVQLESLWFQAERGKETRQLIEIFDTSATGWVASLRSLQP